jgi:hypothetical protein
MARTIYAVTATVTRTIDGWTSTVRTPIFYLAADVQGIVSADHARMIATHMLGEIAGPGAEVHAHATDATGDFA